ncbi:hypothetical protein ACFE04_020108 [Oxalis oulophora]
MECCGCLRASPQLVNDDEFSCRTSNFYTWLLQIFILLGILALCLWLTIRPSSPEYAIVDFSVPTTNSTTSGNSGGNFSYYLEIRNPNKDSSIFFDDILLTFFNGQVKLATDTIHSYEHRKGRKSIVFSRDLAVKPADWKSMQNAIRNATAEVKVSLATRFRFKTWGKKSKPHSANVEGQIPIGRNGNISGKKKKIKLTHKSKKQNARIRRFL